MRAYLVVGGSVGEGVGVDVGAGVGVSVGEWVGAGEGDGVGELVGLGVGSAVLQTQTNRSTTALARTPLPAQHRKASSPMKHQR